MQNNNVSLVLAVDSKNWLWKNNSLVWKIPWDMQFFKKITTETNDQNKKNAVIMWRKTWDSIPEKFRPLSNRLNVILTKSQDFIDSKYKKHFSDIEKCLDYLSKNNEIENIFVIWWADIYNQFIEKKLADIIYLTKVNWDFDCDAFFTWVPDYFELVEELDKIKENNIEYKFLKYKKIVF